MRQFSFALIAAATLAACGGAPREPPESDRALQRAVEAPQDRARAVEAELLEQQRRQREEIDEQGG